MSAVWKSTPVRGASLLLLCLGLAACKSSTSNLKEPDSTGNGATCTGGNTPPDIVGNYVDNYGTSQNVGPAQWVMGAGGGQAQARGGAQGAANTRPSTFSYCSVDNAKGVLIAQNGPQNPYFPNLYSQLDWTRQDGKLWYCQIAYNAQTAEDAAGVPPANPSNPSQGGCGDFPWSELIPSTP